MAPYGKPWCSYSDQVAKLVSRGVVVADQSAAEQFLSHVNYYRFSGYCAAFEKGKHQFIDGVSFEQVRAAYDFDVVLRDIVTEALEVVEVDFRTNVAYHFGQHRGAFGHVDPANFFRGFRHADWIARLCEEASRSSEQFVTHFKGKYSEFPDLPVWMVTEVMSFGGLSQMYSGMVKPDQKAVATRYGIQPQDLQSWMHHLVYVRNLCAHHSRLWDRIWAIKPRLPAGKAWLPPSLVSNERLFATLLILSHLVRRCPAVGGFAAEWRDRVVRHLASPPSAPKAEERMAMPVGWRGNAAWH